MFDVNGVFDGFSQAQEFALPMEWQVISRNIDNLAEYKVVEFILWITWGDGDPGRLEPLTYETIAEYTGLSKQSVASGIEKGIEHGYIERQIEYYSEKGTVRSVRAYGLKLYQPEINDAEDQESLFSDEAALEADPAETQEVCFSSSNEFERYTHSNNYMDTLRIQEEPNNVDAGTNSHPCKGLTRNDNATLCNRVESLSKALGDHEHIASNIGQVRRILARYQAQGGDFEAFLLLMYEARDLARRKTKIRRPNRMPYFFTCLRNASSQHVVKVA